MAPLTTNSLSIDLDTYLNISNAPSVYTTSSVTFHEDQNAYITTDIILS